MKEFNYIFSTEHYPLPIVRTPIFLYVFFDTFSASFPFLV
jgi:hypothetical protein